MSKQGQSYLLSKTALGEVKKGFHELPSPDHVYGKAPVKDKYGAREGTFFYISVIGNWDTGKRSDPH